jgi:hypothetical protein
MKLPKLATGISSLTLFIPAPTLIYKGFEELANKGAINIMDLSLSQSSSELFLVTMVLVSITLFAISIKEFGQVFFFGV